MNTKSKTIFYILLAIIGLGLIIKVFTVDQDFRDSRENVLQVQKDLQKVENEINDSRDQLIVLKKELLEYKKQNQILQLSIDSIVLAKKIKDQKNKIIRDKNIHLRDSIVSVLNNLRLRGNEFE